MTDADDYDAFFRPRNPPGGAPPSPPRPGDSPAWLPAGGGATPSAGAVPPRQAWPEDTPAWPPTAPPPAPAGSPGGQVWPDDPAAWQHTAALGPTAPAGPPYQQPWPQDPGAWQPAGPPPPQAWPAATPTWQDAGPHGQQAWPDDPAAWQHTAALGPTAPAGPPHQQPWPQDPGAWQHTVALGPGAPAGVPPQGWGQDQGGWQHTAALGSAPRSAPQAGPFSRSLGRGGRGGPWGRFNRTRVLVALALVVAAAAVYVAGRQLTASSAAGGQRTTPPSPAAGGPGQPTMLPAGRVGTRSGVPWRLVGRGWVLAEFTAGPAGGAPGSARQTTLYLVDPEGGRYVMYRWPAGHRAWALVDWSGDRTRALLESGSAGGRTVLRQLVLARATLTRFTLPAGVQPVGYSRPDGLNVVAVTLSGGVERFNLAGVLQARLAGGRIPGSPAESSNGTVLAVGAGHGLRLVSNAGGRGRQLPVPGVDPQVGCAPVRWWNRGTVLATCAPVGSGKLQLWLVPAGGGAPSPLAPAPAAASSDNGDLNAWRLSSHLYMQVAGACGMEYIARPGPGGTVLPVTVPGSTGNNRVLGVYRDRMLVLARSGCPGAASLLWFDPAAGTSQRLLAAPPGGAGVLAAVPFGGPNS